VSAFLDRVIEEKEAEIAAKKRERSEAALEREAARLPVRDFRAAVGGGMRIIAEIKKSSPRVAAFRQGGDPPALAAVYAAHGAAAISIVTDTKNFGTSLLDVEPVRGAAPLPVLVKDFVIDTYQAAEARAAGADCLLLIARLLVPERLAALLERTRRLGMAALVECHDEADVAKALEAGADIIGVNNRDLGTLDVSLETTRRLAPIINGAALCVAESGIGSRRQMEELAAAGADAFLIGGALLESGDPGARLRELLTPMAENRRDRSPGRVRVKVCGLTRPADAVACLALGADYLGVIFAKSPRRVTVEQAAAIRRAAPGARLVGVFAGSGLDEIAAAAREAGLDLIQLHGNETPAFCKSIAGLTGLPVIRALPCSFERHNGTPALFDNGDVLPRAGYLLLDLDKDEPVQEEGMRRLWTAAALAGRQGREIFLAGGLDPFNVRAAVELAAPFCVDVCRGVETAPGIKDEGAVEEFMSEVKRAKR